MTSRCVAEEARGPGPQGHLMERPSAGLASSGRRTPRNTEMGGRRRLHLPGGGDITDNFHDDGDKWFHNPDRPWDTATALRADIERAVFCTAWQTRWIRIRFKRHSRIDHVYSLHMPISWADSELWLEVWETLVEDFGTNARNGDKITMAGDFNIDTKQIWENTGDPMGMRIAEFVTRSNMDIKCSGAPTMSWRHPSGAIYDKGNDFCIVKGHGEDATCTQAPSQGRSGHKPILFERRGHRGNTVKIQRAPPQRRLQPSSRWAALNKWKDTLGRHVRGTQDCAGLRLGLEGARRDLEGCEDEGEDVEDE